MLNARADVPLRHSLISVQEYVFYVFFRFTKKHDFLRFLK